MTSKCKVCKKFISAVDGARCVKCTSLFHSVCLKLSPGHRVSNKWVCHICKGSKIDGKAVTKSPSVQSIIEMNDQDACTDINQSVDAAPCNIVDEVRQVIRAEMSCIREELACISTSIANFNRRADDIEMRLAALEERFSADRVVEEARLSALEEQVSTCRVHGQSVNIDDVIAQFQAQLNDREQENFLNDVEISGLQEKKGENLVHIAVLIGKKLGVELEERDVVVAERSGSRAAVSEGESQPRPRVCTIRLARRALRDELLRAARVRRGADTSGIMDGAPRRFYINERLTRNNKRLFYKAREEGRRKGWRYAWTSAGRIFIRHDTNATAHRIRSEADIKKFFSDTAC